MAAPLKSIEGHDIAAAMPAIGRRARAAARALALAPAAQKDGARRHGRGDPGAGPRILAANAEDVAERARPRPPPAPSSTGSSSTRRASRRWPTASRRCAALADPVGTVIGELDAAERHEHRARARAARRHRHHLRKPAERDRRRRRAVPEVRQRRDPARRLGELPLRRAPSTRRWSKACARPACPRRRSSSCRRATAPRSA